MFFVDDLVNRSLKRWQSLAEECQRQLSKQQIVPGEPGTILKDVETMIEFIGPVGIATQSRNASLTAERLPELNAKVSHPIELPLKRALLRDYPNLAGLFILLRVMDLLQMDGKRLVVCPTALKFWRSLNPTEQYFALLEALLFQADSSVLGGERSREEVRAFEMVMFFLSQLSHRWRNFNLYESVYTLGAKGDIRPWNLFLQQQLGLIEIRPRQFSEAERRQIGGRGWVIGGAKLTPWGTAVTWALLDFLKEEMLEAEAATGEPVSGLGERQLEMVEGALFPAPEQAEAGQIEDSANIKSDEEPDESGPEAEFGILQPVFQPYFPEWQTVYTRPKREAQRGTYIFKVSLGGWREGGRSIWRRLAVPAGTSLDRLAGEILNAFKFDRDHLYDFRYRDHRGKSRVYNHPYSEEGPSTTDITVGEAELALKDEMLFTFDYGDNWEFKVRLERIDAGGSRLRRPKVIESAGKAPKQYPTSEW